MPMDLTLLFAISFVANLFSAFAGGGAGLLQLPVLIFLGLPFGVALATHKVASVALGIGATLRHMKEGHLQVGMTAYILLGGLPGVVLGAHLILFVPDRMAEISLGVLTLGLGIYSWFSKQLGQTTQLLHRNGWGVAVGMIMLFVIGVLNGSLTSGTGLFVTIWLVRWFGFDYKTAVAYTLVLVGLFWNGIGATTLGLLGDIRWDWLPALTLGSLFGGFFGAHLSIVKGNLWVKRVFEGVTVLVGLQLIIG